MRNGWIARRGVDWRRRLVIAAAALAVGLAVTGIASADTVAPFLRLQTAGGTASDRVQGEHPIALLRRLSESDRTTGTSLGTDRDAYVQAAIGNLYPNDASWSVLAEKGFYGFEDGEGVTATSGASQVVVFDLYDLPSVPAAFAGANTFPSRSEVAFKVPASGRYVAAVTVTQGAVTVDDGSLSKAFASTGQFDLGTLEAASVSRLHVTAADGPQARWQLSINPLPLAVSSVLVDQARIPAGTIAVASYTVSADATVTATVIDTAGSTVRTLATSLTVNRGRHSLSWDGTDPTGAPLPVGAYTLRVDVKDGNGATASGSAAIQVDPPLAQINLPPGITAGTTTAATATIKSPAAVASVAVQIDGKPVSATRAGTKLSFRPARGWTAGKHLIAVVVRPTVGKPDRVTRVLVVKARTAAKAADHTY